MKTYLTLLSIARVILEILTYIGVVLSFIYIEWIGEKISTFALGSADSHGHAIMIHTILLVTVVILIGELCKLEIKLYKKHWPEHRFAN